MQKTIRDYTLEEWHDELRPVVDNISRVIVGKESVIRLLLTALLAGGHCLIEDVPGVGKTMLVRAAAITLGCEFKRIQFTPDLLPSDVTGVSIYNQKTQEFTFRPGPIFGQIVLADEINRTSPKTQSALLEALEEKTISADGETRALPSPFFVLATENPIEFEGTFPLPEAQLDRFLFKLSMGYPSLAQEVSILDLQQVSHPINSLTAVASPADILRWRTEAAAVHVEDTVKDYLVRIVQTTRSHDAVYLGASPRASLALYKAAKSLAYLSGRRFVIPDDIRLLAPYVLAHRVLLSADARLSGNRVEDLVEDIITHVPIPLTHGAART